MPQRETAKIKQVKDLFKGEFKESKDINTPNKIETEKDSYSRVNILATIEDTYMNSEETYGSIQVTDNTATIRVKAFDETTEYLEDLEKGDLVKVIGKVRKDEDGRFILGEIIKPIQNPEYAELRKLEIKEREEEQTQEQETKQRTQEKEDEGDSSEESFVEETGAIE